MDELWKEQVIDFTLMLALFVLGINFIEKTIEAYLLWTIGNFDIYLGSSSFLYV